MRRWLLVFLLLASPVAAQDAHDVAAIKSMLVDRGINLLGPVGACQITIRVAFAFREGNWGLVAKNPGQNGCDIPGHGRYAVDAIMLPDGTTIDLLINAETENIPAWQPTGSAPGSSWRAPFNLDADQPVPVPVPVPIPQPIPIPPQPPPDASLRPLLDQALAQLAALKVDVQGVRTSLEEHRRAWRNALVSLMKYLGPAAAALVSGLMIGP